MKLFNATVAIAIAAALPSTTSATLRRAPTNNYEERKLQVQDEVGSMPIDAIEPVDEPNHGGFIFEKIFDAKCELAADLVEDRLDLACDNAIDLLNSGCGGRRLDSPSHGGHSIVLCDELCEVVGNFFGDYCLDRRKLKDTSSSMQKIDEERKLQDMEVTALGSVMEEAVKSLGGLSILGDKIFDFKCEVAADLVEERLDIACNNADDLLKFCPFRRRLDSPSHGGHSISLCLELCEVVASFFINYCE